MPHIQDIPLITERLILRPYVVDDAAQYYQVALRNRVHLARFEAENSLMQINSTADAEKVIRGFAEMWQSGRAYFLGAFLPETGEFAAQIYIGASNLSLPEYELGFIADCEHERRGYVTEAARAALAFIFTHLHAHRVRLECDDTNLRSSLVAERLGMPLEGHLHQNHPHPDGSITGTFLYGLLKSEWHG
jgi:RimJ/RimL family protein N-acetyltransferase